MSNFILIGFSGLGLAALYFMLASGLSLIFGLMRVLSFAHGAILTASAYAAWGVMARTASASNLALVAAVLVAMVAGAAVAFLIELLVIRRLQGRQLEQLLATVGVGIALVALMEGIWGPDDRLVPLPDWVISTTHVGTVPVPNNRLLLIAAAAVVFLSIRLLLARTRQGLIIRAGVENREMVSALGINVGRSFTFIFTLGGAAAGLGGALAACFYRSVSPYLGDQTLIFAFIVLIVGGLGSVTGALVASTLLALAQSWTNFYVGGGVGDMLVVILLAVTLLARPQGLVGSKERLA